MIYTIEEAIENIRKFNVGDVVILNEEFDLTQNDYYKVEEEEHRAKPNTPYLITDIECNFDMSEINTYLLNANTGEDIEVEGEMLYQLFNITNNRYCIVRANNEEIDKVGHIAQ
ncbi:TPA: hypothetical protein ACN4VG_002339 [Staphylococcus aureus]